MTRALPLLVVTALAAFGPFLRGVSLVVLAGLLLGLAALTWRDFRPAALVALLFGLTIGIAILPAMSVLWPLPLLLALLPVWLLSRPSPWLARGRLSWREGALGLLTAAFASLALVLWLRLAGPDLVDLVARIPPLPLVPLLALGLLFASANAFAEALAWRGYLQGALAEATGRPALALLVQALSFGLAHYQGFPRGWAGVALAAIYGLALGLIRQVSGGLLAAWAVHLVADLTIYALLATLVAGT